MPMEDKQRTEQIIKALTDKGVRLPCPRCGLSKFSFVGETLIQLNSDPNVMRIGGPAVPAAIVACDNCGYITEHALGPLGLKRG